jgi:hypothetical protein
MIGPTFRRAANFSSEDPRTYGDLVVTNREAVSRWIGVLQEHLAELDALVKAGDPKALNDLFGDAYVTRSVVARPYVDADQAAQSDVMKQSGSFSFQELFLGRRLSDRAKQSGKK